MTAPVTHTRGGGVGTHCGHGQSLWQGTNKSNQVVRAHAWPQTEPFPPHPPIPPNPEPPPYHHHRKLRGTRARGAHSSRPDASWWPQRTTHPPPRDVDVSVEHAPHFNRSKAGRRGAEQPRPSPNPIPPGCEPRQAASTGQPDAGCRSCAVRAPPPSLPLSPPPPPPPACGSRHRHRPRRAPRATASDYKKRAAYPHPGGGRADRPTPQRFARPHRTPL